MKVSIIIFFIGFLTIAPSIWVGIKFFDGKVTEQPYETGLMYDENKRIVENYGLKLYAINLQRNINVVNLQFALEKKTGVNLGSVKFTLTRPANSSFLQDLEVNTADEGIYEAVIPMEDTGYFILIAKGTIEDKPFAMQKSIYIK